MQKKIVFTAALLAAAVFASFSASAGWVENPKGTWRYQDENRNHEFVYSDWRQVNGIWYYFDDYGVMAANRAIYDGNRYYYLDGSGAMVTNTWVKTVLPDSDELRWTYFDAYGKAPNNGWEQINGGNYHFTDGKMDYGLLDADGNMISADEEHGYRRAVYYCGGPDDGRRYQDQWLGIPNDDESYRYAGNTLWLYFNGVGRKVADRRDDIRYANGQVYKCTFDGNGVMTSEQPLNGGAYGTAAAQWVPRVPTRWENREDYENGTERWFYQNSSGSYAKDQIKKIDSRYYLFDASGIMKTGLVVVNDGHYTRSLVDPERDLYASKEEVQRAYSDGSIYYFQPGSGERRSGKVQIDLAEDTYTMGFATDGKAQHGVVSNYLYDRGFLVTAGDRRYRKVEVDGRDYLVNAAGSVMKNGTYTDADGYRYKVERNGDDYRVTLVS